MKGVVLLLYFCTNGAAAEGGGDNAGFDGYVGGNCDLFACRGHGT